MGVVVVGVPCAGLRTPEVVQPREAQVMPRYTHRMGTLGTAGRIGLAQARAGPRIRDTECAAPGESMQGTRTLVLGREVRCAVVEPEIWMTGKATASCISPPPKIDLATSDMLMQAQPTNPPGIAEAPRAWQTLLSASSQ